MESAKEFIAKNIAQALKPGEVVNLGIGIPTLVLDYLQDPSSIIVQAENGIIGCRAVSQEEMDQDLRDAGGTQVGMIPGGSTVDSAVSFGLIRGGHVDTTILGAFQVSENGDIASWDIPGKVMKGVGGAMDLVVGAKQVIVAMTHVNRSGAPKLVPKCALPLTAAGEADIIYTDMAVVAIENHKMVLKAIAPGTTVDEVIACTGVPLIIPDQVDTMAAL